MKIYVVKGSVGEYDDHMEWSVCAYTDEQKAERHSDLAKNYAHDHASAGKIISPYDPHVQIDHAKTEDGEIIVFGVPDYYIEEVDLREELP